MKRIIKDNLGIECYGGNNFMGLKEYYESLEWYLEGMKLFYNPENKA